MSYGTACPKSNSSKQAYLRKPRGKPGVFPQLVELGSHAEMHQARIAASDSLIQVFERSIQFAGFSVQKRPLKRWNRGCAEPDNG